MKFLLPTGIGDSVWALHKIQAIRDKHDPGGRIDVSIVGTRDLIDSRALDFVRRFDFVSSVNMKPYSIQAYGPLTHPDGTYNYVEDGDYIFNDGHYCVLVPNRPLEQGKRLEDWLPHHAINWDIFKRFHFTKEEFQYGKDLHQRIGLYAVFYPGPLSGNTVEGHNRGPLWTPQEWVELGRRIEEQFSLQVVLVGASYDSAYYERLLSPAMNGQRSWVNLIGKTTIGQLYSVTSHSNFVISYQAGVGIVSTYLRTPTAIFWRQHGDSISSSRYLTFDERMASAWVPPEVLKEGTHLPLYYSRDSVDSILSAIKERRWA